jgi:uncharacterized membrane protein
MPFPKISRSSEAQKAKPKRSATERALAGVVVITPCKTIFGSPFRLGSRWLWA